MRIYITRSVIAGPRLKFKRGTMVDIDDLALAQKLIAGGSAELVDDAVSTDAADDDLVDETPLSDDEDILDDVIEGDGTGEALPEIDDDLVVAEQTETPAKPRRGRGKKA